MPLKQLSRPLALTLINISRYKKLPWFMLNNEEKALKNFSYYIHDESLADLDEIWAFFPNI
jgi:hypothetical protein